MQAKSTRSSIRNCSGGKVGASRGTLRKSINKSRLAAAIVCAATSSFATAELKELNTLELSQIRGQAGLTIDIETKMTIGEIEYVDAGSIFQRDISLGGIDGGYLDNLRARVDVSNGTETLPSGFSDYAKFADWGYLDPNETDVAWALAEYDDGNGNFGKQYGDGDLLIHVAALTPGFDPIAPPDPAQWANNLTLYKDAVDLKFEMGSFGLQASDDSIETNLTENFSVEAYLGYLDILITNRGNGFSNTNDDPGSPGKPRNILLRDSYIALDVKFRVEDLDVDRTNNATNTFIPREVTQPGLTLRDFRIHNERGNDTLGSFGFASVEIKTAAASGILSEITGAGPMEYKDGQALYDINVKMDWDLPDIRLGDGDQSIGQVYFTDFQISDTSLVITAHE